MLYYSRCKPEMAVQIQMLFRRSRRSISTDISINHWIGSRHIYSSWFVPQIQGFHGFSVKFPFNQFSAIKLKV